MKSNQALAIIKRRRSTRQFTAEQVSEEKLRALLEAGSCAPYAWEQPLHFAVVQKPALLVELNVTAKDTVKQLNVAPLLTLANLPAYNCLYDAPTLIIVSGSEQAPIPLEADCAAALQNMLLAAESLGLGACWIHFVMMAFYGPQGPGLRGQLGIPEGYKPHYAAVFGHKGQEATARKARKTNLISYSR